MRLAAATNIVTDSTTARRPEVFFKRWAFCPLAVRARVQRALATQKHRHLGSPGVFSPRPNHTIVILVESDVTGGRREILP
jgi:hypothetical protein